MAASFAFLVLFASALPSSLVAAKEMCYCECKGTPSTLGGSGGIVAGNTGIYNPIPVDSCDAISTCTVTICASAIKENYGQLYDPMSPLHCFMH